MGFLSCASNIANTEEHMFLTSFKEDFCPMDNLGSVEVCLKGEDSDMLGLICFLVERIDYK